MLEVGQKVQIEYPMSVYVTAKAADKLGVVTDFNVQLLIVKTLIENEAASTTEVDGNGEDV